MAVHVPTGPHPAAARAVLDPERLRVLGEHELLDAAPSPSLDRLTRLLAALADVPLAAVTLVDAERQLLVSNAGLPEDAETEMPIAESFCQHVVASGRTLVIEDARVHPLVHDNPSVEGLGVRAYAGAPLTYGGQVLGALCAVDTEPRRWSDDELGVLEDLASAVNTELELRAALADARRDARIAERHARVLRMISTKAPLDATLALLLRGVEEELPDFAGWVQADACGVLDVGRGAPRVPAGEERALIDRASRLAVTAVEQARAEAALQFQARHDAITGLGNRRRLAEDLDATVAGGGPATLITFDLDGFKAFNDAFGHPAGDALLRLVARRLRDAVAGTADAYRMGGDEFCVLAAGADHPTLLPTCLTALAEHGDDFSITASAGAVQLPREAADAETALKLADTRLYSHKHRRRTSARQQTRGVLMQILAERDAELGTHIAGVAELAVRVARHLGLDDGEVEDVGHAAELHDVGKVAVPERILQKPGPLDDDEWALMRQHTIVGERILLAAPALGNAARLVRASHERLDGTGYPDGLAGDAIPLGARIIAACDAFDAMVSDRPYAPPVAPAAALAELERCAGTQFDPAVVRALRELLAAG